MSEHKWTPGPLRVTQPEVWPFDIITVDAAGDLVFDERRIAHSTAMNTLYDLMAGVGFPADEAQNVRDMLERQLADAHLRAAAPDLYEALEDVLHKQWMGGPVELDKANTRAQTALAKARGESE